MAQYLIVTHKTAFAPELRVKVGELGRWCRSAFCGALGALWGVRGRLADGGRWRNADRLGLGDRVCRAASGSDGR
jgi:hypothetical protein